MEENKCGGYENHDERRDYASNEGQRSGYSAEGRKLRPRRKVSPASSNHEGEYRPNYGRRNFSNEGRSGYQGHRDFQGRGNGEYGSHEGGSRPRYGEGRPSYGEGRQGYGNNRNSYGEGRQGYGNNRNGYGEGRQGYGQQRRGGYGNNPEGGRRYGEGRPAYGERHNSYGEGRPSYGEGRHNFSEGRPSYGQPKRPAKAPIKKSTRKNEAHFTQADEAGIKQMLSRKPMVDNPAYSDNDTAPTQIKEEIRLNKFIANSGVCSRREADTMIQAGVVTVNGEVVTELGTKINVLKDEVRFNGEKLKGEEKVYIVMNKPKGFVTSASDPHAEKTVMDLLKGCSVRVFPVGRLDKNTTGVLMFTNDGEIAEQLTHPSYKKKKIYQVILDKALDEADKEKILNEGLDLSDGNIKADELEYIDAEDHRRLGIEIHSGKNRIVRRIFESLGYTVKALDRVYFAGLTKKGLKKGEWRYLSEGEVNVLKMGAYV